MRIAYEWDVARINWAVVLIFDRLCRYKTYNSYSILSDCRTQWVACTHIDIQKVKLNFSRTKLHIVDCVRPWRKLLPELITISTEIYVWDIDWSFLVNVNVKILKMCWNLSEHCKLLLFLLLNWLNCMKVWRKSNYFKIYNWLESMINWLLYIRF